MSYYSYSNSNINNQAKILSDLSNYTTKKELKEATCVNLSNVASKTITSLMFQLI